jgi:hypothetical protein
LPTFWRIPVKALKSVVLPAFGLPAKAIWRKGVVTVVREVDEESTDETAAIRKTFLQANRTKNKPEIEYSISGLQNAQLVSVLNQPRTEVSGFYGNVM